jgi:AraC-like DNA-binding protein
MGGNLPEDWIVARGMRVLEQFMVMHGLNWKLSAERYGVDPDLGHQQYDKLPIKTYLALLEHAAAESGNDAAGLMMGSSVHVGFSSTYDYIALSAPSLRVGLQNWVRFNNILSNALSLRFEEHDGVGYLEWIVPDRHGPRTQFLFRFVSWAVTRILYITDDPMTPIIVEFTCQEPQSTSEFQELLGSRIRYNQAHDRIIIPARFLSARHISAEPNLYSIVEQSAHQELQESERSDDDLFTISEHIGEALKNGENNLEFISKGLAMTPRTLQRKLAESGTSFRDLTDEIRKAMAMRYLTDTKLPLSEIAFLLGFSDLSAFSRAAKNWFGVAPREYRRQQN